jgi:hypothetical protein
MQKIFCLRFWMISFFVTLCITNGEAQVNHFVYLQTDNQQPFYVKYNNKVYSSSLSGYLILSKLKDGVVSFLMGFPKSNEEEQRFEYLIDKIDKGFLIKKISGRGWGLYDLQNSAITYAIAGQTSGLNDPINNPATQQTANDPFANMLSKVTQDSTVKNVVVKREEKIVADTPKQIVQQVVKVDTPKQTEPQIVKIDTPKQEKKTEPVIVTPPVTIPVEQAWTPPSKSSVQKLKSYETKEGSDFIFEVRNESGITDTIRLFIPAPPPKQVSEEPIVTKPELKKDTIPVLVEEKKEPVPQQPVLVEQKPVVNENTPTVEKKAEVKPIPNSNCSADAKEEDFIKLRRRMAAQTRDEGMVNEAKKVFKTKCFSTMQIKNLAVLFLNDEWRYRFYDAALPYVTDFSNFKTLSETIQDEYYKKRFFALLPNQ